VYLRVLLLYYSSGGTLCHSSEKCWSLYTYRHVWHDYILLKTYNGDIGILHII
jgi:hypothetical protein